MRRFIALLVVIFCIGCRDESGDNPTGPSQDIALAGKRSSVVDCATQLILEPPCDGTYPEGGDAAYYPELQGEATVIYESAMDQASLTSGAVVCPAFVTDFLVMAQVTPASGSPFYITSTGTWYLTQLYGNPSYGLYRWPPGRWAAMDMSGRTVSIQSALGVCTAYIDYARRVAGIRVNYGHFYGVVIYPPLSPASGGTGAGGNGSNCHNEYIVIEINIGDGTGWHVWWEGWARVCE